MDTIKKILKRILLMITFLCTPVFLNAQEIDIIGLEMRKQFSPNDKNLFMVGFRVQTSEQVAGISQKSNVLSLVDDTGFDILEAHKKITGAPQRLIVFDESRPLPGNGGFLVLIQSFALPASNTKEIQLKADIIFTIIESDSLESSMIENIVLRDTTGLPWQGKIIPIRQSKYRDSVKGDMFKFRLENEDLDVVVQKIEAVDADGSVIKEIEPRIFPDRIEFSLTPKEIEKPINLKISYRRLTSKKIMIDQKIDLGL